MATSKIKPKKKKKSKISPWLVFSLLIILIALISMGISYYLTNCGDPEIKDWAANKENTQTLPEEKAATSQSEEKTTLEGSWVSYYDGAILNFEGLSFVLELPSVDTPEKITGKIAIEKTIVTFYYTSGKKSCLDVEGHYQFTFEKDELTFKVIKDPCASRKERMSANWFRL